jgi:hypothetical protein
MIMVCGTCLWTYLCGYAHDLVGSCSWTMDRLTGAYAMHLMRYPLGTCSWTYLCSSMLILHGLLSWITVYAALCLWAMAYTLYQLLWISVVA